ncbi:MAG: GlsB/YeaQ/YmgE family stress response membrane protein [Verrucomicrobiales bacterium]
MGFLSFLLLGLAAGALAKFIMPGKDGGGCFLTLLLGVIGSYLGGFLGAQLLGIQIQGFFNLQTWVCAVGGSVLLLFLFRLISGKKS